MDNLITSQIKSLTIPQIGFIAYAVFALMNQPYEIDYTRAHELAIYVAIIGGSLNSLFVIFLNFDELQDRYRDSNGEIYLLCIAWAFIILFLFSMSILGLPVSIPPEMNIAYPVISIINCSAYFVYSILLYDSGP